MPDKRHADSFQSADKPSNNIATHIDNQRDASQSFRLSARLQKLPFRVVPDTDGIQDQTPD